MQFSNLATAEMGMDWPSPLLSRCLQKQTDVVSSTQMFCHEVKQIDFLIAFHQHHRVLPVEVYVSFFPMYGDDSICRRSHEYL